MDSRKITQFVSKASRRLKLLFMAGTFQVSLSFGLAAALLVHLISRLSVFPYYGFYAYSAAFLAVAAIWLWSIRKMPRRKDVIKELDKYTPDNRLLTLSQIPPGNGLAADLAALTEKEIHLSYQLFKNERNEWLLPKWLISSAGLVVLLILSSLFPASAQLDAKEHEQEQELIEEMAEKVEKQQENAESPLLKEELRKLAEELAESDTPEQALQELVKKQKELDLQKQKKQQEESEQASEEAAELAEAAAELAEQAGAVQTALSEMGKPVSYGLQQSIAASNPSGDAEETDPESEASASSSENSDEGQQGDSDGSDGSGGSDETDGTDGTDGDGEGETGGEGSEQAAGDGNGESTGESQSEGSQGEGQGSGAGTAPGSGEGTAAGTGAGTGPGNRELLSIPSRMGGTGETTVDDGELSEGEPGSVEKGPVDADRGSVRPYREVVGSYSESYFSSVERMKLPPDLQQIVEEYFSSIESE